MNTPHLQVVYGVVLLWLISTVSGICQDTVTSKNVINIINSVTKQQIAKARSCKQLVKRWPYLCDETSGDLVIGGDGGRCCLSCGDHKCLDTVTKDRSFTLGDKVFTSCDKLVRQFPGICNTLGVKGQSCCRSCLEVDLSCVDDPLRRFTDAALTCDKYIKQDKCNCVKNADVCCKSCENVDTDALGCSCRDLLSAANPAKITITDPTNNDAVVVSKDVDNCKEIVEYYAQFCKNLGGEGGACCKFCEGVDPKCKDNLLWKTSFTYKGVTYDDYTCHDIRRLSGKLMKKFCKDNIKSGRHDIRSACCLQCTSVGYPAE